MLAIKKTNRKWIIIGSIVLLLVAFRIYLPTLVLNYVNKSLQQIEGYTGHVNDIDIHLYRGAYQIKQIDLKKIEGEIPVPFFASETIDLSIEWKSLFKGAFVGEIVAYRPQLNFVEGPTKAQSQTEIDSSWMQVVDDLMPVEINRFKIEDGEVHYRDFHSKPKIDIFFNNVDGLATNLSNVDDSTNALPSDFIATANAYGDGTFKMNMKLDPLNEHPTFDLNAELKDVSLVKLNDFLRGMFNIDVNKGTFGLYTEIAAKDGKFEGYVKPLIKDLDVLTWKKEEGNIFQRVYEGIFGLAGKVLENRSTDQVGTKIPMSGTFKNPKVNIWATIGNFFRNAFFSAFKPTIDNTINFDGEVQTGDKGKDKDAEEEKKEAEKKKKKEEKKEDD